MQRGFCGHMYAQTPAIDVGVLASSTVVLNTGAAGVRLPPSTLARPVPVVARVGQPHC